MTEIEYRAATPIGVDFPKRTIEVIVTPWEREADVQHKGRMIREVFARGAYDGIERRPNRVRVNRDHDVQRMIGRAVAFHPTRDEGLVGELRIARTALGDETLELADEGILDASAEFAVMPGGETWQGKIRRITKAWLGGVALTPIPAYKDASVLAVRTAEIASETTSLATPNRDRLELDRLRELYADLDRRYCVGQH
jgi:HK97 family phage prohead protease